MNRTNRILPTYTGDVSGACSALFELGGMVVIHDPSGCNSTYNTHDETRWYDTDSLIFITGLTERDAVLGNDQKLIDDVVETALQLKPRFVALCNSPVPFLAGTDFVALAKLVERASGIPCFYVPTNGMHDYTVGAGGALRAVAERFVEGGAEFPEGGPLGSAPDAVEDVDSEARCVSSEIPSPGLNTAAPTTDGVNILGVTPLDFDAPGSVDSLFGFVRDAGFEVLSCWAMQSSLDDLARSGRAAVNLVVSSTGLAAAEVLHRRFGTPFVVGRPVGRFAQTLAHSLREAARSGTCSWPARDARSTTGPIGDQNRKACPPDALDAMVIGEPVAAGSIAAAYELKHGQAMRVICPLETHDGLLATGDLAVFGEEEVQAALADARLVVADALYAPVMPSGAKLITLHHHAFSGRNDMRDARDLTDFLA